ncbi:MAG: hypothetical protein K6E20_02765 [Acholeplasmatales bacterium]|nr:hypothetical protein [Acholeplasmatales bacterium]
MSSFNDWLQKKVNTNNTIGNINPNDIEEFLKNIKGLIFPGSVEQFSHLDDYLTEKYNLSKFYLQRLLKSIEKINNTKVDNEIVNKFFENIPEFDRVINTDVQALFDGDPAAKSKAEIILCYPGFTAIFTYRVAHILYKLGQQILSRLVSEHAHSKTGVDIHPGATIDDYFFIDHGTGIVIGETCEIGKHVKIYQGVTLGALSLGKGQALSGSKRHPTVKDNVTIYSGASIFGGNTIIGTNTTIGSNAFITESVEDDMVVTIQGQTKKLHSRGDGI